jgi:aminoglycoside phosphotransferase (APT) family kinase protein
MSRVRQIHDHEVDTGPGVVEATLRNGWPGWRGQPLVALGGTGTDHAMYRVGRDRLARFPRTPAAADSLLREVELLPRLAGLTTTPVPHVEHVGAAGPAFPYPWAVLRRLEGEDAWAARDSVDDPHGDALARDLAGVVRALRQAPVTDLPARGPGQRGGPLAGVVERAERWLTGDAGALPEHLDTEAVRHLLDEDRGAADDEVTYVPTHGDLIPGNVLVRGRRLAAVIDWGYASLADPALDLVPAWALLGPRARRVFFAALAADEATRRRARVNALEQALGGLAYYAPRAHPLAEVMARTLQRVLDEAATPSGTLP